MGTVTAQQIINRARVTLLDDASLPGGGSVVWNRPGLPDELFEHLQTGLRTIAIFKPSVHTQALSHRLTAGVRQLMPDNAHAMIDVTRNLGSDGLIPGRAITRVDMAHFSHAFPDWPTSTASAVVEHWMRNDNEDKGFYVWPPQPAQPSIVELVVATVPTIAAAVDPIPIDDLYEQALYLFVLSHAYAKNAVRGDNTKADGYYNRFLQAIGMPRPKQ